MTSVLVVDDDASLLLLIGTILSLEGWDVHTTPRASEGLQCLDRKSPDVIVLDLSMPEMDGREFYRQAKLRGYDGPVVICSAYGAMAAKRELGAAAALEKPFIPGELVRVVDELARGLTPD